MTAQGAQPQPDDRFLNLLNIALMGAALAVAYILPFELLVLSYAFIGPAHYLTQISWMNDRDYFIKGDFAPGGLALLAILGAVYAPAQPWCIAGALFGALAVVVSEKPGIRAAAFGLLMLGYAGARQVSDGVTLFMAVAVPSVIHVFVFTAAFMLYGALKRPHWSGYLAFVAMPACAAAFFVVPPTDRIVIKGLNFINTGFFAELYPIFFGLFGIEDAPAKTAIVSGFLSWAYTYHYLNWFSKTRLIGWHDMSKSRIGVIVALYIGAIGVYLYDFSLGFNVLLVLSLLHVVLEFPLNWRVFHGIGTEIKTRIEAVTAKAG